MLASVGSLAAAICLPPAGSGGCVPAGSLLGITALMMLGLGLFGSVAATWVILARYGRGEREIPALLGRPFQWLVSASVTCLIGIAVLALTLPAR